MESERRRKSFTDIYAASFPFGSCNIVHNKIDSELLDQIESICLGQSWQPFSRGVFQTELVGGTNDKKRKQVNLQQALGKKLFTSLFDQVQSAVQELYPAYRLYEQAKLLVSYPGCKPQMLHMDFDPDAQLPEHAPLVVFVCVSEKANIGLRIGTELSRPCSTRQYKRGDIFLMHGFAVHRGGSYTAMNFRLYFIGVHSSVVNMKDQPNISTRETFYYQGDQIKKFRPDEV